MKFAANGRVAAMDDVSLGIGAGQFVTLLGPSGSGKTTCLRVIAGIVRPDAGRLEIAGRDVSAVPMHKRNIGIVFQNYALFSHLDVQQNVAYPLRVRGWSAGAAQPKIEAALEMVRLASFARRRPDQLSGGQQQRVALARALVFEPDVLLLDEPLAALDRVLREEMQLELRRIHRDIRTTMICVTHDRSEALAMSDRVIVMRAGRIVQDDTPRGVYERSTSRFVAEFLGDTNVIAGTVSCSGEGAIFTTSAGRTLDVAHPLSVGARPMGLVVRAENVRLRPADSTTDQTWQGVIAEALFLGDSVRFVVDVAPHRLTARLPLRAALGLSIGSLVTVGFDNASTLLFPPENPP